MQDGYVSLRRKDQSLIFDNGATLVNLDPNCLELGSNGIRVKLSADVQGGLGESANGLYVKVGTGINNDQDGLSIQAQHPIYIDSLNKLNLKLSSDLVHGTVDHYGQSLKLSTDP